MLALRFLGGFEVFVNGAPVTRFTSDKTRALLAYLALESDRPHRRASLTGLLWPDSPEAAARGSLSQALLTLRKVLGETDAVQPYFLADRESIRFNRESAHSMDVAQLEALHGNPAAPADSIGAVYRGPLLDGFTLPDADPFEEWLLLRRETLQRMALEVFDAQIERLLAAANADAAAELGRRQLKIDSWREETHRNLIKAYAAAGRRGDALAQYERCKQTLREALGVSPSPETLALIERVNSAATTSDTTRHERLPRLGGVTAPLSVFIGREAELDSLKRLLVTERRRLVTLVGLGGVGKTRLAIQLAQGLDNQFDDGIALVPLASTQQASRLPAAIASAIDHNGSDTLRTLDALGETLAPRRCLLILDNLEQLLAQSEYDATVSIVQKLLDAAPGLQLLVCSRERLGIDAEQSFALSGLSVPTQVSHNSEGEDSEAVQLFTKRARQHDREFALTSDNQADVTAICRLLEGLPLGIELAASWINTLDPGGIAREIENGIDALETTLRSVPERQRSMRATLDQSWRMLTPDESRTLYGLAVFDGGFTRDAAQFVTGATLARIATLTAKSLVQRAENGRHTLHNLVRRYALESPTGSDDRESAFERHATFFAAWAERLAPKLEGVTVASTLLQIDPDYPNLRAALHRLLATNPESALKLAVALKRYWEMRSLVDEGREALTRAIAAAPGATRSLAAAYHGLTILCYHAAEYEASLRHSQAAIEIERQVGSDMGEAYATMLQAWAADALADVPLAKQCFERAIALARAAGADALLAQAYATYSKVFREHDGNLAGADACLDQALMIYRRIQEPRGLALALFHQSTVAAARGDYARSIELATESIDGFRALGVQHEMAWAQMSRGESAINAGHLAEAEASLEEGRRVFEVVGARWGEVIASHHLARVRRLNGKLEDAGRLYRRSLQLSLALNRLSMVARTVAGLAAVALAQGEAERAARWFAAAQPSLPGDLTPNDQADYAELARLAGQQRNKASRVDDLREIADECMRG